MRTGQSPLTQKVIGGIVGKTQHEKALGKFTRAVQVAA